MTQMIKSDDERRTHRITTYLSAAEYAQLDTAFEQSDFDNFSQFHRQLLLDSQSEASRFPTIPPVNKEVAETLTIAVHANCRLIAQLEMLSLIFEQANVTDVQNKIDVAISNVTQIGELCYRWARWYRGNVNQRSVVIDIAAITLTSSELYTLADSVKNAEEAL